MNEMAFRVTSNDGTAIAYDRKGSGPAVVLVGGGLDDGAENAPLVPALAEHFTVYNYARRGRGASGFTEPYAVEREIEDLDALIAEAGGSAHLFGASSGGALALEAAAAGSAIDTIAVWEVPYAVGDDIRPRFEEYVADTRRAFDAGRDEEVLELFMRMTGASDDNIAARKAAGKQTAHWADSVALAPTLVHDSLFLNRYQLPADRLATVTQPVLVTTGGPITVPYMAGLPSDFFHRAADELADLLPHAQRETLEGPDHVVDPQIVGPLLLRFFSSEPEGPARCCGKTRSRHRASRSSSRQGHGRTGGAEVDVVGGITGLILGVLVTNVFVTTQGRGRRTDLGFSGTRPGLLAAHRLRRRSYPALRADSVPPTEALRST